MTIKAAVEIVRRRNEKIKADMDRQLLAYETRLKKELDKRGLEFGRLYKLNKLGFENNGKCSECGADRWKEVEIWGILKSVDSENIHFLVIAAGTTSLKRAWTEIKQNGKGIVLKVRYYDNQLITERAKKTDLPLMVTLPYHEGAAKILEGKMRCKIDD